MSSKNGSVKVAIVGAGQRGAIYANYISAHPEEATVVAVADPRPHRRETLASSFSLPASCVYTDWKALLAAKPAADAVVVAVLDDLHKEVVVAFAEAGYHILCEKPMATSIPDCLSMFSRIKKAGVIFGVGHVLRYSPYNVAVKRVIDSGVLGDIVNIQPVGFSHFVHSYVRGNWKKEADSSFSLMTKCCHDIDILAFYMGGNRNPAKKVSSFGSLSHFRPSKKPAAAGAATRCLDCEFEPHCAYSAKKAYLDPLNSDLDANTGFREKENRARHFVEADTLDIENVTDALRTGPYGLCAYSGQNDVVDHQVVNVEYQDGATASLTMAAFTEAECARSTIIHGTKGELIGNMVDFTVFDFATRKRVLHQPPLPVGGHGGGDAGLSQAFIEAVASKSQEPLEVTPEEILSSHLLVFAAEHSRREGVTVNVDEFAKTCAA